MLTLNDGRNELWQWDTGRKLTVDADCSQVHFSNKVFGRSIDVDVVDGVAIVPDILLQTDKDLTSWAFVGTAENGYTKISKVFRVNKRNKPADYVFTEQDQTTLGEFLNRIEDLENRPGADISKEDIQDAVNEYLDNNPVSVNETDPTVPDWAKQPEPPKTEIPGTLPNPHKLTFSGAVSAEYDGSKAVEVMIPQGGGGSGGGSSEFKLLLDITLEEEIYALVLKNDSYGNPISCNEIFAALYVPETFAGTEYFVGAFYPNSTAGQVSIPFSSGNRHYTTFYVTPMGGIAAVSNSTKEYSVPVTGVASFAITPGGSESDSPNSVFVRPDILCGIRFTGDYRGTKPFPIGTKVLLYGR